VLAVAVPLLRSVSGTGIVPLPKKKLTVPVGALAPLPATVAV
jgi:hypothetical protein